MVPESRDDYEELEGALDPHRKEERDAAVAEVAARLRDRGGTVTGAEDPGDLASLLDAGERFETAGESHRGGPMVGGLQSPGPHEPHLLPPRRGRSETIPAHIAPVD